MVDILNSSRSIKVIKNKLSEKNFWAAYHENNKVVIEYQQENIIKSVSNFFHDTPLINISMDD